MQMAGNDNYQCKYAYFSRPFPNSYQPVRVFTSVNHGNNSAQVHDSKTFPQPVSRRVLWQAVKDPVQTAPSIGSLFKATSQVYNMDKRDSPFLQPEQNAPE